MLHGIITEWFTERPRNDHQTITEWYSEWSPNYTRNDHRMIHGMITEWFTERPRNDHQTITEWLPNDHQRCSFRGRSVTDYRMIHGMITKWFTERPRNDHQTITEWYTELSPNDSPIDDGMITKRLPNYYRMAYTPLHLCSADPGIPLSRTRPSLLWWWHLC